MRIAGVRVAWVALCHADCWCARRVGGAVPCGWLVSVSRGWRCAMRIAGVRDCCRCQTACEGCASQDAAAEDVVQHRLGRGPLLLLGVCLCGPPRSPPWGAGGRSVSAWVACCRCQTACEGCASQDAAAVAVLQHCPGRGPLLLGCVSAHHLARPHGAREDAACPPGSRAAAARQRVKAVRPKTLLP